MPRQLKLEAEAEPVPAFSSVVVTRAQIPADLTLAQKAVLRQNFESHADGEVFFFRDCSDVRHVLRMGASHA